MRIGLMLVQNREIARRLHELESRVAEHDGQILSLVRAIRQLAVPGGQRKRIDMKASGKDEV